MKVYWCLLTCAIIWGIHLEIVQDLTAETFLLAFRKFVGWRSLLRISISDNGFTYLRRALVSDRVTRDKGGTGEERCYLEIHPQECSLVQRVLRAASVTY